MEHEELRRALLDVVKSGAKRVIAIHWDSLFAPIDGPLTGEMSLLGRASPGAGDALRRFLTSKREGPSGLPIHTLPRYAPVVLVPVRADSKA